MKKDELRKIYLSKRQTLTENQHRELSHQISERFFSDVDLSTIKFIHIFLPIESKREVNTWFIIDRLLQLFPHIHLVIPRVSGDEMESILFEGKHQLEKTRWGMVEPTLGTPIDSSKIDVVLVPLLAVDKLGHRIGYGKGYYDRFLKSCRQDCIKIGISLFDPEEVINERLEADVMLNHCITPTKTYSF